MRPVYHEETKHFIQFMISQREKTVTTANKEFSLKSVRKRTKNLIDTSYPQFTGTKFHLLIPTQCKLNF